MIVLAAATVLSATASPASQDSAKHALPRRNWLKRFFCKPSWNQALAECRNPREVCRMVERHVTYREEAVDQWSSSKDTWQRGTGDCEDFAICVQAMCRELGFDASIEIFYPMSPSAAGHAIAVGQSEDGAWISSNGSYEKVASPEETQKRVARILWCRSDKIWNLPLADADVEKLIRGASAVSPVATSAAK